MELRNPTTALVVLLLTAGLSHAADFAGFANEAGALCASRSSTLCYERVFAFADADGSGALDQAEAARFYEDVKMWSYANKDSLAEIDRQYLFAGLLSVQMVGIPTIMRSYDADGDGVVSRDELAADVHLDERPIHELVRDPNAIEWQRLKGRLGRAGMLLDSLRLPG